MSCRFESDFYIVVIVAYDFGIKLLEALIIVGKRERLVNNFAFGVLDKAVVLVQRQYHKPYFGRDEN